MARGPFGASFTAWRGASGSGSCEISTDRSGPKAPQKLLRLGLQLTIPHILWLPSCRSLAEATVASLGLGERTPRAAGLLLARAEGPFGINREAGRRGGRENAFLVRRTAREMFAPGASTESSRLPEASGRLVHPPRKLPASTPPCFLDRTSRPKTATKASAI